MTDETNALLFECRDGVARIRLNRPHALNAINEQIARGLLEICQSLRARPDVRVIILSGEGRCFCAGGDLARFQADLAAAPETAAAIINPLHEALLVLTDLPQPVIASLHGAVAGGGFSLSLAADLAIAAEGTKFNVAYATIGASPDGSMSWALPRVVGLRKALQLALLGETVTTAQALELGLVNQVVAADALEEETLALARRLAAGPTAAYGRAKRLLRMSHENTLAAQLQAEEAAFRAGASTEDFAEGINAFFEKRKPAFRGC